MHMYIEGSVWPKFQLLMMYLSTYRPKKVLLAMLVLLTKMSLKSIKVTLVKPVANEYALEGKYSYQMYLLTWI